MRHRFANFEVLERERQLLVAGTQVPIGARAFDVLLSLIARRDRVVAKNELLDCVWPGLVVEENNLQVQIHTLRKLLGPQAITTVPGRGYQFTQPSLRSDGDAGPASAAAAAPQMQPYADSAIRPRTNVPAPMAELYGRADDEARIRTLLDAHPVVSIVAPSGVGKTRLAQSVARALREAYPDGVWWVELATVTDGALVAAEVARVLGVQLSAARPPEQAVADFLRTQSLLLLLDNCEHVLSGVAPLVSAIALGAPRVRVLVTSQETLKTTIEQVYRLDTLAVPDADSLDAAEQSGAVQLFVNRIKAAHPHFVLDRANVEKVAAICRRLDGIPLALELAAARVPLLGLDGLHARLDERFRVLTGGSRFVLRRHQTLRAAMDFSHALLTADEQTVFRRLGVFAGSFGVESAQRVVADAQIDPWAVLDHLGALVDKSMVIAESGEYPRLKLLETARAYALEKLADAGETNALLERHARAMEPLMAAVFDAAWRLSEPVLRTRYGPELDNLRVALDWALAHDAELAISLAGSGFAMWRDALMMQPEGARYCEAALRLVTPATPPRAHGRLLHSLAWMLLPSQQKRARATASEAADLLRQADDPIPLGNALLALITGTTPDAKQYAAVEELKRLHDPASPPKVRAQWLSANARLQMGAGNYPEALRLYAEVRRVLASGGAVYWEALLAWTVGEIMLTIGDVDAAIATLEETARKLERLSTRSVFLSFAYGSLATAHLFRSDPTSARNALATGAPLIVRYNVGFRYAATAALLAACEGRWAAAGQLLGYSEAATKSSGVDAEQPAEIRARERAAERLAANAPAGAIGDWKLAGAALATEAAYRLALEH